MTVDNTTHINYLFFGTNELFFTLCSLHHSNESYSKIIVYSFCQPSDDTVTQPDKLHVTQFVIFTFLAMLISYYANSVSWYNKMPVYAILFMGMYLCMHPILSSNLLQVGQLRLQHRRHYSIERMRF